MTTTTISNCRIIVKSKHYKTFKNTQTTNTYSNNAKMPYSATDGKTLTTLGGQNLCGNSVEEYERTLGKLVTQRKRKQKPLAKNSNRQNKRSKQPKKQN